MVFAALDVRMKFTSPDATVIWSVSNCIQMSSKQRLQNDYGDAVRWTRPGKHIKIKTISCILTPYLFQELWLKNKRMITKMGVRLNTLLGAGRRVPARASAIARLSREGLLVARHTLIATLLW